MSSYSYAQNIKTPAELGISTKASYSTAGNDIIKMGSYVDVLISGQCSKKAPCASKTGGPLGNKYFYSTGGQCKDSSGNMQDRYLFVNNIPTGNLPILDVSTGMQGLIPGIIGDMGAINPVALASIIGEGSTPECSQVTLDTVDDNNNTCAASYYIAQKDQTYIDGSLLNHARGRPCGPGEGVVGGHTGHSGPGVFNGTPPTPPPQQQQQGFTTMQKPLLLLPNDYIVQFFFAGVCVLGLYIIFKIGKK